MFHKNKISKSAIIFLIVFLSNIARAELFLLCPAYLDDLTVIAPNAIVSSIEVDTKFRPNIFPSVPSENDFFVRARRELILQTKMLKKPIETVLYPASGSDAITVLRMFVNATTIIGIDNNPFVNSNEKQFLFHETKNRTHYDIYHKVLSHQSVSSKPKKVFSFLDVLNEEYDQPIDEMPEASMLEIIVTDILGHFPESEIIAIEQLKIPSTEDETKFSISGRIIFQEKPNGAIKTYYHIHRPKTKEHTLSPNDPTFEHLADNILNFGFDAVVAKASLGAFGDPSGVRFLDHIFKNGGVFIDGDDITKSNVYTNIVDKNKDIKISKQLVHLRNEWNTRRYTFGYDHFVNFITLIK